MTNYRAAIYKNKYQITLELKKNNFNFNGTDVGLELQYYRSVAEMLDDMSSQGHRLEEKIEQDTCTLYIFETDGLKTRLERVLHLGEK